MFNFQKDNFTISSDKERLNIEIIYQFLSNSYWAKERNFKQVKESIENSLCFGIYETENQIGFARVITDQVTFAYLADVFIIPSHQGIGLGKWLVDTIFNIEELKNITSWILLTNDAQKLYEHVGFQQYPNPERVMIRKIGLTF